MIVSINNNVCSTNCSAKLRLKLFDNFKVRHPNAFHLRRFMPKGWDGKIPYYKENGKIATGLYPQLRRFLMDQGVQYEIEDFREIVKPKKIAKKLNGIILRDYQVSAVEAVAYNMEGDVYFPRGIIKAATNAGKNIIMCAIYKTFKLKTFVVMNSKEMFETTLEESKALLPGKVGWITSKEIVWNDFMVVMVQTVKNRIPQIKHKLAEYQIGIVDECDLADNKTNKKVIQQLYNCSVMVGLSGTVALSDLKKHEMKNQNTKGYFGDVLYEISNRELIDKGYSSEVVVTIHKGNTQELNADSYDEEYTLGIIKNKQRNRRIIKRLKYHVKKGRIPALIIAKRHKHVKRLYYMALLAFPKLRVAWVHHRHKDRRKIIADFKAGKIDILIGSRILGRAKNFPMIKYMANAGGGLSQEDTLQYLGRATRTHESKDQTYYEDFHDKGRYLARHSRARERYYRNEKLKVIKKY